MEIILTEILSPVGDTVDLIDYKSVNFAHLIALVKGADQAWTFDDLLGGQVDNFIS